MRVLHWYSNYLGGGAVANAVLGIAAAQARQGSRVTIASAEARGEPLYQTVAPPTDVELLVWRPAAVVKAGGQYVRVIPSGSVHRLREVRPDVVHVHGEFNVENLWVPRLFRCPHAISPHGAFHPVVVQKSRRVAKRLYLAAEARAMRRLPVAFHALSPMEAQHTAALFPDAAIYCVPQGPSPAFCTALASGDVTPSTAGRPFTCAFVGRLDVYTKGLDILLDAFASLPTRTDQMPPRLVIAGPDWNRGRDWLERRVRECGLTGRVQFAGALSGGGVASVLASSDAYVQLSRHEGFPLSIVEALLSAKPVVLSNTIGTISYPEIASLPHVKIVPPIARDAAIALTQVWERLAELREAALDCHDALRGFFSWERAASLHLEAYARWC